jgi:hypothetical protein
MINHAPVEVIRLLAEAYPKGVREKNQYGKTPMHLGMENNAPHTSLSFLRLHSLLPAVRMAQHATHDAGTFQARDVEETLAEVCGGDTDVSALYGITDSHFLLSSNNSGGFSRNVAQRRFERMLINHQNPPPDGRCTSPLSERLAPIRDVLTLCLQTELQFATTTLHTTCNFQPYQQMYLNPAIQLIHAELTRVKTNVRKHPDTYRHLLMSLSTEDRKIYNSCFEKSINADLGGVRSSFYAPNLVLEDTQHHITRLLLINILA